MDGGIIETQGKKKEGQKASLYISPTLQVPSSSLKRLQQFQVLVHDVLHVLDVLNNNRDHDNHQRESRFPGLVGTRNFPLN